MSLSFGTSGLRGLVTELDAATVAAYTRAFLAACPPEGPLFVGRDLRPSSPDIAAAVIAAAQGAGVDTVDCGALATPALALAAMAAGSPAVMVTGSHIPADRNGLKFYRATGEITKQDEAAITAAYRAGAAPEGRAGTGTTSASARSGYVARYAAAFGPGALAGLRIGVYQHSSVARDVLVEVLAALGAAPVPLARSDTFIPVDTEAVDPETRAMLAEWCAGQGLDAVASTDGDGDRPMLTDATGAVIPGDVLGVLSARALGAQRVVTPVSSNSMVTGLFDTTLTRIGSPYVVAAMEAVLDSDPAAKVVGFEANGGFLLGFAASAAAGTLPPLMTRDALLPILAPLAAARAAGGTLAGLVADLPPRFTAADRVQRIDPARARSLLADLSGDAAARAAFFAPTGEIAGIDQTDGLRVTFDSGEVVHLRPSGNAPEFRVYAEADSRAGAEALVAGYFDRLAAVLAAPRQHPE